MRRSAVVSPDGLRLVELEIGYAFGDGVRIWPAAMLATVGYRPADDHKDRAIDGSITDRLTRTGRRPSAVYYDLHPLQVIDFKTNSPDQRTSFRSCASGADKRVKVLDRREDFWGEIAQVHSEAFADAARAVYRMPVAA